MNRSLRKHLQNQFLGNVEASLLICRIRPPSGSEASSNGLQSEGLVSSLRCYWEVKDRAGVGEVAHLWGGGMQASLFSSHHKVSMATLRSLFHNVQAQSNGAKHP